MSDDKTWNTKLYQENPDRAITTIKLAGKAIMIWAL